MAIDPNLDFGPPPGADTSGQYSLPITFPYQPRPVAPTELAKVGQTNIDANFFQRKGKEVYYTGPQLVNEKGQIERGPYGGSYSKLQGESYQFLASISDPVQRRDFLIELADRGLYEGGKPSRSGFDGRDIEAVGKYLLTMDRYGTTARAGIGLFRQEFSGGQMGGTSIRVTAKEDVQKVLADESLRLLGRALTTAEAREAVRFVQQQQVQRASGTQQAPALSTSAATAVTQGREEEVAVQGAARAAQVLERLIGR